MSSSDAICSAPAVIRPTKRASRSPSVSPRASVFAKPLTVASGGRRSWHASETSRGKRWATMGRYGSYPMTATRGESTLDVQASVPEVRLGLPAGGVPKVAKAIRIEHAGREQTFAAEIACVVDLDPAQKGVHMSRFPELFGEAVDEVVIGEALLVESLASHIAAHVVDRQEAVRAEVRIEAQYPIERRTPVTGLPTQEIAKLIGIASATHERVRRVIGVEATGINACPCAQGMVRGAAAERLLEAGFEGADIDRILELVPLATHNQRGHGTLLVGTDTSINAERLVEIVEASMSSPVYELLKRPDELFVVEHAHLQPRFVEDSVRIALKQALDRYPVLEDGDFLFSRQVNLETIHDHDVLAERGGTVGELRSELEPGAASRTRPEPAEWLGWARGAGGSKPRKRFSVPARRRRRLPRCRKTM